MKFRLKIDYGSEGNTEESVPLDVAQMLAFGAAKRGASVTIERDMSIEDLEKLCQEQKKQITDLRQKLGRANTHVEEVFRAGMNAIDYMVDVKDSSPMARTLLREAYNVKV